MTTVSGRYCDTWADATHGMPNGVSLNAPYKFHWVNVDRVDGETLHCSGAGEKMALPIKKKGNRQYVVLTIKDPIFGPLKFETYPFKAEK